jgi:hypothetical protein
MAAISILWQPFSFMAAISVLWQPFSFILFYGSHLVLWQALPAISFLVAGITCH